MSIFTFIYKDNKNRVEPQPIFNGTDLNGESYWIFRGKEFSLWGLSKLSDPIILVDSQPSPPMSQRRP